MIGDLNDVAERAAVQLAIVCAHAEEIRSDLNGGTAGDDTPLERLLAAAIRNEDVTDALAVLHAALQADGDPQGLHGYSDGGAAARGLRPAGISAATPGEAVYRCPTGRCARYSWPQGGAAPRCGIFGKDLRRDEL